MWELLIIFIIFLPFIFIWLIFNVISLNKKTNEQQNQINKLIEYIEKLKSKIFDQNEIKTTIPKENILDTTKQTNKLNDFSIKSNKQNLSLENTTNNDNLNEEKIILFNNDFEKIIQKLSNNKYYKNIKNWILTGNPIAKIAAIVALIGIAFLLKYSIDNFTIPIEVRIIAAIVVSLIFLMVGWKLRDKNQLLALIIQGVAIGGLYITIYASYGLFKLLPMEFAFILMIIICACAIILALIQNAIGLAWLASFGGYIAPIILSNESSNYIILFSYYLVISIGILVISYYKSWRRLNLLGLFFTFGMGILWGYQNYQDSMYIPIQIFLVINIILFGFLTTIFQAQQQKNYTIDATLFFVPALIGFAIQYYISNSFLYANAISTLIFASIYLCFAYFLLRKQKGIYSILCKYSIALGIGFATFAIPLMLSGRLITLVWLMEGTALIWAGLLQKSHKLRLVGFFITILAFLNISTIFLEAIMVSFNTVANYSNVSILIISAITYMLIDKLFQIYTNNENKHKFNTIARRRFLLILSLFNWVFSFFILISLIFHNKTIIYYTHILDSIFVKESIIIVLSLLFFIVIKLISKYLHWLEYQKLFWFYLLCLFISSISIQFTIIDYKATIIALVIYSLVFSIMYYELGKINLLFENDKLKKFIHIALMICLFIATRTIAHSLMENILPTTLITEELIFNFIYLSLFISFLIKLPSIKLNIFNQNKKLYTFYMVIPIAIMLSIALIIGSIKFGNSHWPYFPIINPFEISAYFALISIGFWILTIKKEHYLNNIVINNLTYALIILFVCWLNSSLLRGLTYYTNTTWDLIEIWDNTFIQTTLSIIWAMIALLGTIYATKNHNRNLWWISFIILMLVLLKLFMVDSKFAEIWRAVSFIGVAVLMFIIAYIAPLPPKKDSNIKK